MNAVEYRRLTAERHRLEMDVVAAKAALTLFDERHPETSRAPVDIALILAAEDRTTAIDWAEAVARSACRE